MTAPLKECKRPAAQRSRPDVEVLIVGCGISGLCMGVLLRRSGRDSFLILEKSNDLGGTWRDNRYPGCACDIPSHLYSLSFAPSHRWTRMYPTQPELLGYLRELAERHRLRKHIRFNTAMERAEWDAANALWQVTTSSGTTVKAAVLISGIGALHVPARPRLPGIENFEATHFHSAQWRSDFDVACKRVGVIGTGASAVQLVPEIAPLVDKLYVFQRTPPWIVPKFDRNFSRLEHRLFKWVPGYRRAFRLWLYGYQELRALGLNGNMKMLAAGEELARQHLERQVGDPELRGRLTPQYRIGCKRVLISNDYYPALTRANVELITEPIVALRGHDLFTADGTRRRLDLLVYATGFEVVDSLRRLPVIGRNATPLSSAWADQVRSYYGICVSGFPNFFMLLGPNTGLGHNSVVLMIEAQAKFITRCLEAMRRHGLAAIEVKPEVQDGVFRRIQDRLKPTVWQLGGCRSWYQDHLGRNVAIWPGFTFDYRWQIRRPALGDFRLQPA